jgi:hypothetical protein
MPTIVRVPVPGSVAARDHFAAARDHFAASCERLVYPKRSAVYAFSMIVQPMTVMSNGSALEIVSVLPVSSPRA